jgi:hypothetical protein
MAARDWPVKKAFAQVQAPGEQLLASAMVSLPGSLKRDGFYAAVGSVTGIRMVSVSGENGLPTNMVAAVTDRRILLFSQHWLVKGKAKDLVADIDLARVAGARQGENSRAQISLKVANFTIDLRDGNHLDLESADGRGAEGLVAAVNSRALKG